MVPWGKCRLQSGQQSQVLNLAKRDLTSGGMFESYVDDGSDVIDEEIMAELEGQFLIGCGCS